MGFFIAQLLPKLGDLSTGQFASAPLISRHNMIKEGASSTDNKDEGYF